MAKNKINHKKQKIENNIVSKLISSPKKGLKLFKKIPVNNQGFILLDLPKYIQRKILNKLRLKEITNLFHYLDPDEIIDLLQNMDNKNRKDKIIKKLKTNIKEKINFLLKFNPNTAAGIMNLDYIEVGENLTFGKISKVILKHEKRTGKFPTILAVENGCLVGELQGHVLALHKGKEKIYKYIKKTQSIKYDKNENEVIQIFKKNRHNKVVVLDEDNSILGIIYSDDVLKLIEKRSPLHKFAGVKKEENIYDSAFTKVKNRYNWLIINLGTAFLAATVVSFFQQTIATFTLLAVYMPVIAGMGGNAGTQTLAVVIRGLTLKEIKLRKSMKIIFNEFLAGGINGTINGVLVAIIATLFNKNAMLGLIVGLAMVINLMIAGFFGTIIPLIMQQLGKDPASSATIFITTATDVFGFLVFLGLASILL